MERLFRSSGIALMLAGTIAISGCEKDLQNEHNPAVESKNTTVFLHLESSDHLSLFTEATQLADFKELLHDPSVNYTVLAPTNDALKMYLKSNSVGSLYELKDKIGEQEFRNLISYHFVKGKYDERSFPRGFVNSYGNNEMNEPADILVADDVRGGIGFNGTNENAAIKTEARTVGATNGNVIEIDNVLNPQSNLENFMEGFTTGYQFFNTIHKGADSYFREKLRDETGVVITATDNLTDKLIQLNFRELVSGDLLKRLLERRDLEKLMKLYNVRSTKGLADVVKFEDLKNRKLYNQENFISNFSEDEFKTLTDYIILNGNSGNGTLADSKKALNRAGGKFDVELNGNYVILTDIEGNKLFLDAEPVNGSNGSIYKLVDIFQAE